MSNMTSLAPQFVIEAESEPESGFNGQIWIRSTDGQAFQYFEGDWESIGVSDEEIKSISRKQALIF